MEDYEIMESYNEFLNEVNAEVVINGMSYSPSYVLREVDPIAYRVGLADYESMLEE